MLHTFKKGSMKDILEETKKEANSDSLSPRKMQKDLQNAIKDNDSAVSTSLNK